MAKLFTIRPVLNTSFIITCTMQAMAHKQAPMSRTAPGPTNPPETPHHRPQAKHTSPSPTSHLHAYSLMSPSSLTPSDLAALQKDVLTLPNLSQSFLLPIGKRAQAAIKDMAETTDASLLSSTTSKAHDRFSYSHTANLYHPSLTQTAPPVFPENQSGRLSSMDVDNSQRLEMRRQLPAEERPRLMFSSSVINRDEMLEANMSHATKASSRAKDSLVSHRGDKQQSLISTKDSEDGSRAFTTYSKQYTEATSESDAPEIRLKPSRRSQQEATPHTLQDASLPRILFPLVSKDEAQELQPPFIGSDGKWHFQMLPSRGPTSRKEVILLQKWMDKELEKLKSSPEDQNDTMFYSKELLNSNQSHSSSQVFEACYHELIRQVSVTCQERGDLLEIVWDFQSKLGKKLISDNDKLRKKIAELEEIIVDAKTNSHVLRENINSLKSQLTDLTKEKNFAEECIKQSETKIFRLSYDLKQCDTIIGGLRRQIIDLESLESERQEALRKLAESSSVRKELVKKTKECETLEKKIEDILSRNSSKQYKLEKEIVRLRETTEKLQADIKKRVELEKANTSSTGMATSRLKAALKERGSMSLQDLNILEQAYPAESDRKTLGSIQFKLNPKVSTRKPPTQFEIGAEPTLSGGEDSYQHKAVEKDAQKDVSTDEQINSGLYRTIETQTEQEVKVVQQTFEVDIQTADLIRYENRETQVWPSGPLRFKFSDHNSQVLRRFRRQFSSQDLRKLDRKADVLREVSSLKSFASSNNLKTLLRLPQENPNMRIERLRKSIAFGTNKVENVEALINTFANVDVQPTLNKNCDKAVQAKLYVSQDFSCQASLSQAFQIMEPMFSSDNIQASESNGAISSGVHSKTYDFPDREKSVVHSSTPVSAVEKSDKATNTDLLNSDTPKYPNDHESLSSPRHSKLPTKLLLSKREHELTFGPETVQSVHIPKSSRDNAAFSKAPPSPRKMAKSSAIGSQSHPSLNTVEPSHQASTSSLEFEENDPISDHKHHFETSKIESKEERSHVDEKNTDHGHNQEQSRAGASVDKYQKTEHKKRTGNSVSSENPLALKQTTTIGVNTDPVTILPANVLVPPTSSKDIAGNGDALDEIRSRKEPTHPRAVDEPGKFNENQKIHNWISLPSEQNSQPSRASQNADTNVNSHLDVHANIESKRQAQNLSPDTNKSTVHAERRRSQNGQLSVGDMQNEPVRANPLHSTNTHPRTHVDEGIKSVLPRLISIERINPDVLDKKLEKADALGTFLISEPARHLEILLCLNKSDQVEALKDRLSTLVQSMSILITGGYDQSRKILVNMKTPRLKCEDKSVQLTPRYEDPRIADDRLRSKSPDRWIQENMRQSGRREPGEAAVHSGNYEPDTPQRMSPFRNQPLTGIQQAGISNGQRNGEEPYDVLNRGERRGIGPFSIMKQVSPSIGESQKPSASRVSPPNRHPMSRIWDSGSPAANRPADQTPINTIHPAITDPRVRVSEPIVPTTNAKLCSFTQAETKDAPANQSSVSKANLLRKRIFQFYVDRVHAKNKDPKVLYISLSQFVRDSFLQKYGLKSLAEQHLKEFLQTLKHYIRRHPQIQLFARFCGYEEELCLEDLNFYIHCLGLVMQHVNLTSLTQQRGPIMIPSYRAEIVIDSVFDGVTNDERFLAEVKLKLEENTFQDPNAPRVDLEWFLVHLLEQWRSLPIVQIDI